MIMSLKIKFHVLKKYHIMFTPSNTGLTSENTMVSHGITVQEKSWPVSEFCTNNIAMLLFIRYIAQHYEEKCLWTQLQSKEDM